MEGEHINTKWSVAAKWSIEAKTATVQAPKGRYIPAQGGGVWRALLLAVSPQPWVTAPRENRALKGRPIAAARYIAPSGLNYLYRMPPPWAGIYRPFGARPHSTRNLPLLLSLFLFLPLRTHIQRRQSIRVSAFALTYTSPASPNRYEKQSEPAFTIDAAPSVPDRQGSSAFCGKSAQPHHRRLPCDSSRTFRGDTRRTYLSFAWHPCLHGLMPWGRNSF
jgi:hypothetical protein